MKNLSLFLDVYWPVSGKILSPLVILSMEKTMVAKVISELKSNSRLKIFRETEPWSLISVIRPSGCPVIGI